MTLKGTVSKGAFDDSTSGLAADAVAGAANIERVIAVNVLKNNFFIRVGCR